MAALSAYQQLRKVNLGENTQFLAKFGLQAPIVEHTSVTLAVKESQQRKKPKLKRIKKFAVPTVPEGERRFSFRVRLKAKQDVPEDWYDSLGSDSDSDSDFEEKVQKKVSKKEEFIPPELLKYLSKPNRSIVRPPRPNTFGSIQGVKVGTWWETRLDCSHDGIHRPTVAGIHPGPDGAYSVALSGGYEDDVDLGDSFTYTGEGGRDLKGTANNPKNLRTAPQSKDQALVRGNLALSRNADTGNPVRVIRGYKLASSFAPERGYRYDGLYNVTKYWQAVGKAGFKVYKFQFQRCDSDPAPWHENFGNSQLQETDTLSLTEELIKSEETDWCGWPIGHILPKTDCFSIVSDTKIEKVQLVGDEWHLEKDLECLQCSDKNKQQQAKPSRFSEYLCESKEAIVSPLLSLNDKIGNSYFTVIYEGCCVRVCWSDGEWQEVEGPIPRDFINIKDLDSVEEPNWLGWP